MPATAQDGTIWKDSHYTLVFHVHDIHSIEEASIFWKLAPALGESSVLVKVSSNPDHITIDGNSFYVHITPNDTQHLPAGLYYHEARATGVWGNTRPVALGKLTLRDTLTTSGVSLEVMSQIPEADATEVDNNVVITIVFDRDIEAGPAFESIEVNDGSTPIEYTPLINNNELTLTPTTNLPDDTLIDVLIPATAVVYGLGTGMAEALSFSFQTEPS